MSDEVATLAVALAVRLPTGDLGELSAAAARGRRGLLALRARSAAPAFRDACDRCLAVLPSCGPDYLAGTLAGAARLAQHRDRAGTVEVVWTGPQSQLRTSRLTSAVVSELIGQSREEVLLVSYATHTEPGIASALQAAIDRGVQVTLLLERAADNASYSGPEFPFPALAVQRLHWPAAQRPDGAALHAKILVVDTALALVGSANLTGRALERNLECGVLIRGGSAPAMIRAHLHQLLEARVLQRTTASSVGQPHRP